jgi:hypothetical protein
VSTLILNEVHQAGETQLTIGGDKLAELLELTAQIAIDQAAKHPRPIEVQNSQTATSLCATTYRVFHSLKTALGLLEEVPEGVDADEWEGVTGLIHNAADALGLATQRFEDCHVAAYAHQVEGVSHGE